MRFIEGRNEVQHFALLLQEEVPQGSLRCSLERQEEAHDRFSLQGAEDEVRGDEPLGCAFSIPVLLITQVSGKMLEGVAEVADQACSGGILCYMTVKDVWEAEQLEQRAAEDPGFAS